MQQSLSLLELFDMLDDMLNIRMEYTELAPRQSDQKVFVADITKIKNKIGWEPKVSAIEGIKKMIEWTIDLDKY